jgi:hypothetical protein
MTLGILRRLRRTRPDPATRQPDDALAAEVAALGQRLARIESLLIALYGEEVLGGAKTVKTPPKPERTLREVATMSL